MNYGKVIRKLRIDNRKTQEDMANILNVERVTYSHYEVQEKIIPIKRLIILSDYFKVSLDYIFEFTSNNNYNDKYKMVDEIKAGEVLKKFRKSQKLTQVKLATFLNTTFSTIAFYEKGRNLISTSFLYAICEKYGVSADYLLGRVDEPMYFDKK